MTVAAHVHIESALADGLKEAQPVTDNEGFTAAEGGKLNTTKEVAALLIVVSILGFSTHAHVTRLALTSPMYLHLTRAWRVNGQRQYHNGYSTTLTLSVRMFGAV